MKTLHKKAIYLALAVSFLTLILSTVSVMQTKAALSPLEDSFVGQLEVSNLAVELFENGERAPEFLLSRLGHTEPGKTYEERIAAHNSGSSAEYVRVIIRKYWSDADGVKDPSLDPQLIHLTYFLTDYNAASWQRSEAEHTKEKDVYYLTSPLTSGAVSPELFNQVSIDRSIMSEYKVIQEGNIVRRVYQYDGYIFTIEAEVQSVQTSHAEDAIRSVWGVSNVTVNGESLIVR